MRKLTLLSSVFLMGLVMFAHPLGAQTYKFKSTPRLPVTSSQVTVDQIYVPTNVPMTNIRVGLHIKAIYYSTLRVVLTIPTGEQIVLKAESPYGTNWFGSIGSERSYCLIQDGGNTNWAPISTAAPILGSQPNDRPMAPATPFATYPGRRSQGYWTLTVTDNRASNVPYQDGSLEGWVVMFNSVVLEPEVPIVTLVRTGSQLIGILNGQTQLIPNERGAIGLCFSNNGDPSAVPGRNGDAFPFVIANTGYPGLQIGQPVPGYMTPGRFKISVTVATNNPPPTTTPPAFTGDIAVYFGKAPSYTPPLQNPPVPANTTGTIPAGPGIWPIGNNQRTATLLPNTGSPTMGGVRLVACNDDDTPGWNAKFDQGVLDVQFDDLALTNITNADYCPPGPGSGVCGTYRPEQALSLLNGAPLDGLYYVTMYDTFGENFVGFGHVRVLQIRVEYLAGGGQTENQLLHQGIAGPLMGVPIPGRIVGGPALGYLGDVIGPMPVYSIHAKEQDPLTVLWATQKLYPRSATGYERLSAVSTTGYIPPSGVLYIGPFAYPASLDANKTVGGALANVGLIDIPVGTYRLRSNLVQARYDDDQTDNEFQSSPIQVTPTTLAYYGTRVNQANYFNGGTQGGLFVSVPMQVTGTALSSIGQSFTLFKNPSTKITSVDYKMDLGYVVNQLWRTNLRVAIWRVSSGFFGAPVGPPVAMSPTISANEYMPGNWRTFPIFACDNAGVITSNRSVDLAPGTYVVTLENMANANALLYPYTYGMMPFMADRYWDTQFSENFGPVGPFSTHGTRMVYQGTVSPLLPPPTGQLSTLGTNLWGNFCLPIRLNMTTQNDFAINHLNINGTNGAETVSLLAAPFQPNVSVTAASLQNGQTRDFNVRLEIYSGQTRVYLSDKYYGPPAYPGINQYQTVSVPMDPWNPTAGGVYRVKITFSRNPDDQNPANDSFEYNLYVNTTRSMLVQGAGASQDDLNAAMTAMKNKNVDVEVVSINDAKLADVRNQTVVFVGSVPADAQQTVASLIANGNDLGFVYNRSEKFGTLLRTVDQAFQIDRPSANYDRIDLFPKLNDAPAVEAPVRISEELLNLKLETKEDFVNYMKSRTLTIEAPEMPASQGGNPVPQVVDNLIPAGMESPYGEITFVDEELGSHGIIYAVPAIRKPAPRVDAVEAPQGFVLGANYPNPFNPSTVISYTLPEQSVVTLRVLDMLGREVLTLVNETQPAGVYNVNWKGLDQNGAAVASGQYLYRIDAVPVNGTQPFSAMRKMTFAK